MVNESLCASAHFSPSPRQAGSASGPGEGAGEVPFALWRREAWKGLEPLAPWGELQGTPALSVINRRLSRGAGPVRGRLGKAPLAGPGITAQKGPGRRHGVPDSQQRAWL